jgi:hypothetical protein
MEVIMLVVAGVEMVQIILILEVVALVVAVMVLQEMLMFQTHNMVQQIRVVVVVAQDLIQMVLLVEEMVVLALLSFVTKLYKEKLWHITQK